MKRVMLVCVNDDPATTGFSVRVLLMAEALRERGYDVVILRLYTLFKRNHSWTSAIPAGARLIEIPLPFSVRYRYLTWLAQLIKGLVIHVLARVLRVDVIQGETHPAGEAALNIRWSRIPVLVDLHGAAPEEALMARGEAFRQTDTFAWLEHTERVCVSRADALLLVAEPMRGHLESKHGVKLVERAWMVPVAVEDSFFGAAIDPGLRRSLGFEEQHVVFVYSGGTQVYQCIRETLSLFARIRSLLPEARLLVLTGDISNVASEIERTMPQYANEAVLRSLPKQQVANYLAAADFGFLLRLDDVVNRVSCPTKFGEYLACGLPVIATEYAGHAGPYIAKHGVGILVGVDQPGDAESVVAFARSLRPELRHKCRELARAELGWNASMDKLEAAYTFLERGVARE